MKCTAILLSGLLLQNVMFISRVVARGQSDKEVTRMLKLKARIIEHRSDGKLVTIQLRNKTKIKGYIQEASEDNFVIKEAETAMTKTIAYGEVAEVKSKGKGLSTFQKVAIGWLTLGLILTLLGANR